MKIDESDLKIKFSILEEVFSRSDDLFAFNMLYAEIVLILVVFMIHTTVVVPFVYTQDLRVRSSVSHCYLIQPSMTAGMRLVTALNKS